MENILTVLKILKITLQLGEKNVLKFIDELLHNSRNTLNISELYILIHDLYLCALGINNVLV